MKQGEKLNYAGRVKRRARGSGADFEVVSDLNPYGIEMALTNGSEEVHRFEVYKKSGGFITDYFDTSAVATTYRLEVSLIIDGVQIAAGNNATVKIEPGVLSKAIGETLPTPIPVPSSEDRGTIESGEWEYLIEVAQSGSEMSINSWSSREEISLFCFGTVLKGPPGDTYTLTEQDKKDIAELVNIKGPSIDGLATEDYVNTKIGDIDTILDSIITVQSAI